MINSSRPMIALGTLLLGVGLFFKMASFPDIFFGIYSGPLLIIVGIILGLRVNSTNQSGQTNRVRVSSKLTFVYKSVVPLMGGLLFFGYLIFLPVSKSEIGNSAVIVLVTFGVLYFLFVLFSALIQDIEYSNNELFIGQRSKQKIYRVSDIERISRLIVNIYMIEVSHKKFYFTCRFSEFMSAFPREPESVSNLRLRFGNASIYLFLLSCLITN